MSVDLAFPILGRSFEAHGVSESLARWLQDEWRRPTPATWAGSDFRISLRTTAPSAEADARERGQVAGDVHVPDDPIGPGRAPGPAVLGSVRGGATLEVDAGAARIWAWGADEAGSPGREHLRIALHDAVRASGPLPLHCAAAVRPGEAGATVFLGSSGAGKSTTLLTAARSGWDPVCEDFAWLDPMTRTVYAWDRAIRLLPDTLTRFHVLGVDVGAVVTGDGKRVIPYEALARRFGVVRRTAVPLRRLVWLKRDAGPARWEGLAQVDAVPMLWSSIGLPLTDAVRRTVAEDIAGLVDVIELATVTLSAESLEMPTMP